MTNTNYLLLFDNIEANGWIFGTVINHGEAVTFTVDRIHQNINASCELYQISSFSSIESPKVSYKKRFMSQSQSQCTLLGVRSIHRNFYHV